VLHNDFVELMSAPPRVICDGCWELVIDAITYYHHMHESPNALDQPPKEEEK
jgi:hypothetical protein